MGVTTTRGKTVAARRTVGRDLRARQRHRTWLLAYLFIAPTVLLTAVFSLVPLGMLAYRSLYHGGVFDTQLKYSGLRNYRDMLSQGGSHALGVTGTYTVGFVLITMSVGLALALLLNSRAPGVRRLRAPFIIPLVVPIVATALIWSDMLAPRFGLVNRLLTAVHLPEVDFLSSPRMALLTVLTFGAWQFFGQNVILYLAALKALPADVMEAAEVDGAGAWTRFRHIQWPMVRHQTLPIWVITTLTGLQTFTQIFVLTQGGPQHATQTALYYFYNEGFVQFDVGRADAMGVLLFLLSLVVTVFQMRVIGRRESHAR